jgi:hypothetical protein
MFLLLPFITKLFSINRKHAWIVLSFLTFVVVLLRGVLTAHYDLQACLGSTDKHAALDQSRDQTVVYNKP